MRNKKNVEWDISVLHPHDYGSCDFEVEQHARAHRQVLAPHKALGTLGGGLGDLDLKDSSGILSLNSKPIHSEHNVILGRNMGQGHRKEDQKNTEGSDDPPCRRLGAA